jgi:hypothetical protein
MKTIETKTPAMADLDAVLKHVMDGTPVEPELARRVEERANRITEELRQRQVPIDIEQLLADAREEA